MHTRFVYDGPTGFNTLWRNGVKVVDLTETGTAYNDDKGPYFKIGIYKPSWKRPEDYTVRHCEL